MSQLRVGQVLECHANGTRWRVMHQLPGRVRLQLLHAGLDAELAQALAHQSLQRRWVKRFRLNALAGSLVLEGRPERLRRRRAIVLLLQQAAQQEAGLPLEITPRLEARSLRRLALVAGLFSLNALLELPLILLLLPVTPLLFVPLFRSIWATIPSRAGPPTTANTSVSPIGSKRFA